MHGFKPRGWYLAVLLALAPHAAAAQPFALDLRFGSGVEPCFDSGQLIAATRERMQDAAEASMRNALAVQLRIDADGDRWRAVFTSEVRTTGERGEREIAVAPSCDRLLAAVSLVLALIVEQEAPAVIPQRRVIDPRAPVHAAPRPLRVERTTLKPEIGAAAGAVLGVAPAVLPVVQASVLVPLRGRIGGPIVPLFLDLGVEGFLPRDTERPDVRVSIAGGAIETHVCPRLTYRALSLEPCPGLWLRAVQLTPAETSGLASATFVAPGWDVRLRVRARIAAHWSLFALGDALVPFTLQTMRLHALAPRRTNAGNEFFNAPVFEQARSHGEATFAPYRIARVGVTLLAGFTFVL